MLSNSYHDYYLCFSDEKHKTQAERVSIYGPKVWTWWLWSLSLCEPCLICHYLLLCQIVLHVQALLLQTEIGQMQNFQKVFSPKEVYHSGNPNYCLLELLNYFLINIVPYYILLFIVSQDLTFLLLWLVQTYPSSIKSNFFSRRSPSFLY